MRNRIIQFFKENPVAVRFLWKMSRIIMTGWGWFVPIQKKTIIFCAFGGRKYDDSPKAIYDRICELDYFKNWRIIWAFAEPERFEIPRGEKVQVDTLPFFKALLYSKVWVSNSGMDRGIGLKRNCNIRVETWHGAPLKKIGGEEHQNSFGRDPKKVKGELDNSTIRCAQSEYDRAIFQRIMHATKDSFLLCDLPRNDSLLHYNKSDVTKIREKIGVGANKKIILYAPTYREYLIDKNHATYMAPPINLEKWEHELGGDYCLLIRAHYAVNAALNIKDCDFVKNVSDYPYINDLYAVSDVLISDYSSSFIDYSILDRPMLCFAYDEKEYEEKRGLYIKLEEILPSKVDYDEDSLLNHILTLDYEKESQKTRVFHQKFAPYAGHASEKVVNEIIKRLENE